MLERAVARAEAAFGGGVRREEDLMEMGGFGVGDAGEAELLAREEAVGFQNLLAVERDRDREEAEVQQRSLRQRSGSRNREQQQQQPE
jgi:hypothetical protein